ncbi:1-acyl-sn-glycerol-3-phosphate acyltransferase [Litorimonas taeanensis]|uniref:1-acyl-sn-glycerol-3-phosphate acyltransferase n=1 Tax=Litorimonas taeanensis TaxID=568099 RepID=A0A420WF05_9PROT|nr:lysophospholipid acyltransferase family protein [Litorimonas taeanensis]RKQ69555.1 1-acyl-sn-glycerol-3-phosphate acyltransferase [Litorimonas taeanensis]
MRSTLFNIFFYAVTTLGAVLITVFTLIPGRKMTMIAVQIYTKIICWGMRFIAGIKVNVKGREHIPDGLCILAAKHQSYGDGHVIFSHVKDLSFVTGDQLLKIPLLKQILNKMNAVVIDSCGGSDVRQDMDAQAEIIKNQGRRILIFPEGHLSEIGTHHRYRKGVWHLYNDFNCPVIPVANSLGQRWNQMDWKKHQGHATIEFMEPIAPGMDKESFMALLQERVETQSIALLDHDNLGALNPQDIGLLRENETARQKRAKRENEAGSPHDQ